MTLLKKEITIGVVVFSVIAAIGITLNLMFAWEIGIIFSALALFPYVLYLFHSEKTYVSIPDKAKKFIKEKGMGDILEIKDIDIEEWWDGTCEYDYALNTCIKRKVITTKGAIEIVENYLRSDCTYSCAIKLIS